MKNLKLFLGQLALLCVVSFAGSGLHASAMPYQHVQAVALVSTSPVSRFVTLKISLRNIGGIATSCVVKAGSQKRITGLSANGDAEVIFDALLGYKGYTVTCQIN